MKIICAIFSTVLCAGCASWFEKPTPQVVKVAVAQPCKVDVPARPAFPADDLSGDEDIFEIGKRLWADHLARRAYIAQIETALKGCTE